VIDTLSQGTLRIIRVSRNVIHSPPKTQVLDLFTSKHSSVVCDHDTWGAISRKVIPFQAINNDLRRYPPDRVEDNKLGKNIQYNKNR